MRDRRALSGTVTRRRRYSPAEKQAILKAVSEAGATVSEVSRRYGVGRSLIHNWRRQEAVAMLGATVRFAPVSVAPEKPAPGSGTIEIELDGGVRVRVEGSVDEVALGRVLRALGR